MGWRFTNEQKDCAELISRALEQRHTYWSEWEQRNGDGEVRETGACPVLLSVPGASATALQTLIDQWSGQGGGRYLTTHGPLLLQIGRSTEYGKNTASIDFDDIVRFPVLCAGEIVSKGYSSVSGVVHVGERVTSGHYRALLKHGAQWYYADDGVPAVYTRMSPHINCNVYTLWLQPSPAAAPNSSLP